MSAALRVSALSVRFGGVQALDHVDLEVEDGQLVGLIGPNGAGKTTFLDAITGFVPASGRVILAGEDLRGLSSHARARRGLARTWQNAELFDDLSVAENLAVASRSRGRRANRNGIAEALGSAEVARKALATVGLDWARDELPAALSHGERKLIGVARALVAGPRVLCLDEPAAGQDGWERERLRSLLRRVADEGTAILLIDHDMDLVFGVCNRIVVLNFGQVIATGSPETLRRDPAVVSAYLGAPMADVKAAVSDDA
jgi:branched-chain amino acid transport system ATP-binding protein